MTFQRIAKTATSKPEIQTKSQFASRPFAPITQQTKVTPDQQTQGLAQRKTNLLEIPGLMTEPRRPKLLTQLIQPKLTIGQPGDKYEQEAYGTAHQVVQMIHHQPQNQIQPESLFAHTNTDSVQCMLENPPSQESRLLTDQEYEQIKDLCVSILKKYPPNKYCYIGLGKSPTPVLAFLQEYGVEASNIALSKFNPSLDKNKEPKQIGLGNKLTKEQYKELKHHFDRFIPQQDAIKGKKILLIDYTLSGRSLYATYAHLTKYLNDKYSPRKLFHFRSRGETPPQVVPLALYTEEMGTHKLDETRIENKLSLPGKLEDPNSLASAIGGERYKPLAEYPEDFRITAGDKSDDIQRDPNRKYQQLRQELSSLIQTERPILELMLGRSNLEDFQ
ncbi:hypothetical protein [Nostoc sp. C117]|uniref:hypothetical protein n=1 Tax=Nostoc sp. C117 TaxID=3349875 RepID=UPI00370D48D7